MLAGGNTNVMLCERGIRAFESFTRFTLDVAAIPVIQRLSHLPIVADPSHSTGKWYLVTPVALAAIAGGAHGLLIEVHPNPDLAKCDGPQSLTFPNFSTLMDQWLKLLNLAKQETGLPIITEVMTPGDVDTVAQYSDVLQVGARNMQNYNLLDAVGETRMPVMVKRGLSASYEEWLLAAEMRTTSMTPGRSSISSFRSGGRLPRTPTTIRSTPSNTWGESPGRLSIRRRTSSKFSGVLSLDITMIIFVSPFKFL